MHFSELPVEILLKIFSLTGLSGVICLRQTCRYLYLISRDKILWLALLDEQELHYPLCNFSLGNTTSTSPSAKEIEQVVKESHGIHLAWKVPRQAQPFKVHPGKGPGRLILLQMFFDRWLLLVYGNGKIYLWDTYPSCQPKLHATLVHDLDKNGHWTQTIADVAEDGKKIVVASTRDDASCDVVIVPMHKGSSYSRLRVPLLRRWLGTLKGISLSERVIVLTGRTEIRLVTFPKYPEAGKCITILSSQPVEDDNDQNNIDIQIHGSYMFILRPRSQSLEVYNIKFLLSTSSSSIVNPIPLGKHIFPGLPFDNAKLSFTDYLLDEMTEIKFKLVALDHEKNLHCYKGHFEPSSALLTLTLAHIVASGDRRNYTNAGNLNLISYSVGWHFRRGVTLEWIQSPIAAQAIRVWSLPLFDDDKGNEKDRHAKIRITMDDSENQPVVHVFEDQLYEMNLVAISESTGVIAWGNGVGEVFLLGVDDYQ